MWPTSSTRACCAPPSTRPLARSTPPISSVRMRCWRAASRAARSCWRGGRFGHVGWAKARKRRAHLQVRSKDGGHASLCPPYYPPPNPPLPASTFRRFLFRLSRRLQRLPVEFVGELQGFVFAEALVGKAEHRVLVQRHDQRTGLVLAVEGFQDGHAAHGVRDHVTLGGLHLHPGLDRRQRALGRLPDDDG